MCKTEFENVRNFTKILGLENKTDGTLFLYKKPNNSEYTSLKPDGYYFLDGVTFILDAKAENKPFTGQLNDYMKLESNDNFIGFQYNFKQFKCFVKGKLIETEKEIRPADYYIQKYFPNKITNPKIVNNSAKKLANLFRDSEINKQMNVPFIGAVMLCLKFKKPFLANTTEGILNLIKQNIQDIIADDPVTRRQKKEFLKTILGDSTLKKATLTDILNICEEITNVYNFINVSDNQNGHDTMNNFLKVFRIWNSANAKEKGEVFTPDHIAKFMCKLIDLKKEDYLLDPCCGSGTFLTNAMAYMLKQTTNYDEQFSIKENHVIGIEKNDFNATLAGINMMLHGDGASNIWNDDCFNKLKTDFNNCYDKVLMNPPFSKKKSSLYELNFVLETLNHMKEGGILASILPLSCAIGQKFKDLRKELLKKHSLLKVITLPKDLFQPNAGTNTCIMVFKAKIPNPEPIIEQYDFSDDGYIIAKHIGRIDKNYDEKIRDFFKQKPVLKKVSYKDDWLIKPKFDYRNLSKLDFMKSKLDFMLINKDLKTELLNHGGKLNYNLSISSKPLNISDWKEFKIGDIFEHKLGDISKISIENGDFPLISCSQFNNGIVGTTKNWKFENCISVATNGCCGKCFYHNYKFGASIDTMMLFNENLNQWNSIFILTILEKILMSKYTYGNKNKGNKTLNEIIKLPTKNNLPDWEYMEKYIKNKL